MSAVQQVPPPVHVSTSPWSTVRSFTVTANAPGAPGTPTLTAPADGARYHPYESFLTSWTAVPGAAGYRLEHDNEPTFAMPQAGLVNDLLSDASRPLTLAEPTSLYVRVRAVAADGTRGLPSAARRFTIAYDAPIPAAPAPLAPAAGAPATLPASLDWTSVTNERITGSAFTVQSLSAGTKYWRVRSSHGLSAPGVAALTAWSAVRSFTLPARAPVLSAFTIGVYGDGLVSTTHAFSGTTTLNRVVGTVSSMVPPPPAGRPSDWPAATRPSRRCPRLCWCRRAARPRASPSSRSRCSRTPRSR